METKNDEFMLKYLCAKGAITPEMYRTFEMIHKLDLEKMRERVKELYKNKKAEE